MATAKAEIIIKIDGQTPARQVLDQGEYVIGRDETACHILVESEAVSRQHAKLVIGDGQFHIEDLGSTLGTFVNGAPVTQRTALSSEQKVQLGNASLEFRFLPTESSTSPPEAALKGRHYQVGSTIAQGGMGAILSAQDLKIKRTVAMKVIRSDQGPADLEGVQRFIREAEVIGRLEHPNIVPIHELGVNEQGQVFYTMKLVKGVTLRQVLVEIKAGKPETLAKHPLGQLLTVFQKVCDAMAFAHAQGVIHRDLKPENIMLGEFGEVLVMDWGLAKILGAEVSPPHPALSPDGGEGARRAGEGEAVPEGFQEQTDLGAGDGLQTMDGTIMGTPSFMAPEQAEGKVHEMDGRTDIFALGGILYSILTLRPPATGATMAEMLANIKSGYIAPPVFYNQTQTATQGEAITLGHCPDGQVPEALSAVAMKALATQREARYQTVEELQKDLAAYQGGFATSAEEAGAWKLMLLALQRNKTLVSFSVAALAIFLLLTGLFVFQVVQERNRTKTTLTKLQGTAPTFYANAQQLLSEQKLTNALERITYATELAPNQAEYHALRGSLLQALLQIKDARQAYAEAVRCDPKYRFADENLKLCEKLLKDNPGAKELTVESLEELRAAMLAQGRNTEAIAIGQRSGNISEKSTADILAKWKPVFEKNGWKGTLTSNPDRTVKLVIDDPAANDLSFIKGMPLSELILARHSIKNLAPLRGSLLKNLSFSDATLHAGQPSNRGTAISDLSDLQGLPLKSLTLYNLTNLTDLTPLKGMLLESLDLGGCGKLEDLRPIKGLPIKWLSLDGTKVSDINPLRGMPLRNLFLNGCFTLNDLSALEGMSLESLSLGFCHLVKDLRPLKGMPLQQLVLMGCGNVNDLSQLEGIKLDWLDITYLQVSDIRFLKGMPLQRLGMKNTKVADISPLEGAPLIELRIEGTKVTSLASLRDSPLTILWIDNTPLKDLTPIQGKKLTALHASSTPVRDLAPLKGMPLTILDLNQATSVSDISALQGVPLTKLYLAGTQIRDLSVLKDMPLVELDLSGCTFIKDLGPLATCRALEKVALPRHLTNLEPLRNLYDLKFIGYANSEKDWDKLLPAADFWKAYDARKK